MGVPLSPQPISTPLPRDQANFVVSGSFTGSTVGPTAAAPIWGTFNVFLWGTETTTLATTAGSSSATVGSATGLVAGQSINSPNVPHGTTIGAISGTTVTLAFPPGHTNAEVLSATDAAAVFNSVAIAGTIQLERSFDGGATWLICGIGGSGTQAQWVNPSVISIAAGEPEKGIGYRLNMTAHASGTLNYRISATGQMAVSLGVQTV